MSKQQRIEDAIKQQMAKKYYPSKTRAEAVAYLERFAGWLFD